MYKTFFNLKEDPFGLNPDPHFLFPSERHREAFRYLIYGIKNREGFIEVIGDVGTGKTLLCRALLALLGEETKTALILNPPFTDVELLEMIMEDLGIQERGGTRKETLDIINGFLFKQYAQGKNVVIIIDEAQHLTIDMLEQIRLLSNLETEKKKLLQIVIVGQPELEEKLRSPQLRQLDQRIALRYYLEPLKPREVKDYVYHRLRVAGSAGDIKFNRRALRQIYKFSHGIPRLINVVCDKALLTAYFFKTKDITGKHIKVALRSTQRRWKRFPALTPLTLSHALYSFLILTILFLVGWNLKFHEDVFQWTRKVNTVVSLIKTSVLNPQNMNPTDRIKEAMPEEPEGHLNAPASSDKLPADSPNVHPLPEQTIASGREKAANPAPLQTPTITSSKKFERRGHLDNDAAALLGLLDLWNLSQMGIQEARSWDKDASGKPDYARIAARYGLDVVFLDIKLEDLEALDFPCILFEVKISPTNTADLVLKGLDNNEALVLHPQQGDMRFGRKELVSIWKGKSLVLWRNLDRLILDSALTGDNDKDMLQIDKRLKQLGYLTAAAHPSQEQLVHQRLKAIKTFQQDHNLKESGVCDIRTKLILYNIIDQPYSPTLKKEIG